MPTTSETINMLYVKLPEHKYSACVENMFSLFEGPIYVDIKIYQLPCTYG